MKNNMECKDIFALTREDIKAMSHEERNAIRDCCEWHMEANDDFSNYYLVYALVGAIEQEEYLAENEGKLLLRITDKTEGLTTSKEYTSDGAVATFEFNKGESVELSF